MKKLSMFVSLLVLSFILVACGSNSEVVGVWEDEMIGLISFEFQEDGTLVVEDGFSEETGTYRISGSKLNMELDGEKQSVNYKVDGEQLILTIDGESIVLLKVE